MENVTASVHFIYFFSMTFCLGLTYAVRFVEMSVAGREKYFALTVSATINLLNTAILQLYWLI